MSGSWTTLAAVFITGATLNAQTPASLKDAFKDLFRVGAAVNQAQFDERDTRGSAIVRAQFDTISPENVLKWESLHPQPAGYRFEEPDNYVAFGEKNHIFIVGHTLVWHNQTPRWVFQDDKGEPLGREALLQRMREHIQTVVGRYKGRIGGWDVVNEALNEDGTLRQSPWMKIIGEDYIAKAFEFAHEADPKAELYYNDYSLENEPKRKGAVELIRKLKGQGIPVAAVGLQGHDNMDWPTVEQQDATIAAFAQLGVKVNITELDIDVLPRAARSQGADVTLSVEARAQLNPYANGLPDAVQQALAKRYAELFGVFVKYRGVVGRVTFWGVTDGDSWLNNWPVRGRTSYPLLFDRNGHPKPAFDAVIRAAGSQRGPQLPPNYPKAQYDEQLVPQFTLPDPLVLQNGKRVGDARTWTEKRRPEILQLFATHVYGKTMVGRPKEMTWEVVSEDRQAMGGKAIAKTVRLYFAGKKDGPSMDVNMTLPNTGKAVPVFLLAGGFGKPGQLLFDRGYGTVAARIDQIQLDKADGYAKSIRKYFAPADQQEPGEEEWGAIGAWAWSLSRAMDYLETDKDVDARRVSLNGVSRFGKVAMWAGAQDERFAITFSGESGCGGHTIVRRGFGETVKSMTGSPVPAFWFDKKFKQYADRVNELPVDWHELVACYAPRPVYIATAEQDYWGDPRGSFLSAVYADPVYKLFGKVGLGVTDWPPVETPVGDFIGYHNRKGVHGQNDYDWEQYLNFADRHFGLAKRSK